MIRRLALLGLSGVGKSTLVLKAARQTPLLHLEASRLIKAEQAHRAQQPATSEELRIGPVLDNQNLLIAAFQRMVRSSDLPVVFDGHSLIDGRNGLVELPSAVFTALELDLVCFLEADPLVIFERRRRDLNRERPLHDVETLATHQLLALNAARRIARDIDRPFHRLDSNGAAELVTIIESVRADGRSSGGRD